MNPMLMTDFYKTGHIYQYPKGTEFVYSNWTPRKSRVPGVDRVVFFGLQYVIKKYLIEEFNRSFFRVPKSQICRSFSLFTDAALGDGAVTTDHIEELHDLGYLPVLIKALPEGTHVPIGVPCFTIVNTDPKFFWVTNFLETLISCTLWQACTSATLAGRIHALLSRWQKQTHVEAEGFVDWQGHDFSMRGMSSLESAIISGMGHLVFFKGTDTIPAIVDAAEYYDEYDPEIATGIAGIGGSVPATEHSVACMGSKEGELNLFDRLISEVYPKGIVSLVSDTWNLWQVVTEFLPVLKDKIMSREGKVVIRPDSSRTTPQDIICGTETPPDYENPAWREAERKGLIECLWDVFGGTINEQGYKVLDSHIGAIYGDAINFERCQEICERLERKGFASTNIIFGVGSFTYQHNTRDTFGFAMKATWGQVNGQPIEIFKDPLTDSGEKKSAKGLMRVYENGGRLSVMDQQEDDDGGLMEPVFLDGELLKHQPLSEIRARAIQGVNSIPCSV
jgi:nicotinamide phosphoribosyltransferase